MPTDDIYRKLQKEIDRFPIPYPETVSKVEIKLLKLLFTPQEAEIAVHLSILPESIERITRRLNRNGIKLQVNEAKTILDSLVDKGAILGKGFYETHGKGTYFSLSPFVIGFFENQVDIITRDFAENAERLLETGFYKDLFGDKKAQMRTIPISEAVSPDIAVEPYDTIRPYVKQFKDQIAVINCVCEQAQRVQDVLCTKTELMERCLLFGDSARFVLSRGLGREITNEEALKTLDKAENENLVLQPQNSQNPGFICCCCPECCGVLKALRLNDNPGDLVQSNYFAELNVDNCTECGDCQEICPMDAIQAGEDGLVVNNQSCIGCGLCISNCPTETITLKKRPTIKKPYKNSTLMYRDFMFNRFGVLPTVKNYLKYLMGGKF